MIHHQNIYHLFVHHLYILYFCIIYISLLFFIQAFLVHKCETTTQIWNLLLVSIYLNLIEVTW